MRANVYALMEVRNTPDETSADLWAVWGTFREAMDHYVRLKGYEPSDVEQSSVTDPVTGEVHDVWKFDHDQPGWAWIAQYRVPLTETFD